MLKIETGERVMVTRRDRAGRCWAIVAPLNEYGVTKREYSITDLGNLGCEFDGPYGSLETVHKALCRKVES